MNQIKTGTKSLICGLVAVIGNVFLPLISLLTIPGVYYGHKALKEQKYEPDNIQKRFSIAGLLLNYSIIITTIVIIILVFAGVIQLR
jgi:hypothetical protein